jgi:hypothetical protein
MPWLGWGREFRRVSARQAAPARSEETAPAPCPHLARTLPAPCPHLARTVPSPYRQRVAIAVLNGRCLISGHCLGVRNRASIASQYPKVAKMS